MVKENNTPWKKTYRKINGKVRLVLVRKFNGKYQIKIIDKEPQSDKGKMTSDIGEMGEKEYIELGEADINKEFLSEETLTNMAKDDKNAVYSRMNAMNQELPSDIRDLPEIKERNDINYAHFYTSQKGLESKMMWRVARGVEDGKYKLDQFSESTQKRLKPLIWKM